MYEACKITVDFGSGSGSGSGQGPLLVEEMRFTLQTVAKGDWRYFQAKSKAAVVNVRFDTQKLDLDVFASFTQPYPSKISHDAEKERFCHKK